MNRKDRMEFDVQNEDDFVPISVAVRVCPPSFYNQNICVQVRQMAHVIDSFLKAIQHYR